MARIRTIKPEFFRHEKLQGLGATTMLVFAGLLTVADREGRFRWKPNILKLDILPFLDFDMADALSALSRAKIIAKYKAGKEECGVILNWGRHQLVGRDEPPSDIPAPDGKMTEYLRPPTQTERIRIYQRDKYTCAYCGREMANDSRAICLDHVTPYSRGGSNHPSNLVVSCKKCNAMKGDKTPDEAGLTWPGTSVDAPVNHSVNRTLTGGKQVPDMEREREKEREKEREEEKKEEKSVPSAPASATKHAKFTPPTDAEMIAYMRTIGGDNFEAAACFDHYTANGWRQSNGNKIRDWKAAARNWHRRQREFGSPRPAQRQKPNASQPLPHVDEMYDENGTYIGPGSEAVKQ